MNPRVFGQGAWRAAFTALLVTLLIAAQHIGDHRDRQADYGAGTTPEQIHVMREQLGLLPEPFPLNLVHDYGWFVLAILASGLLGVCADVLIIRARRRALAQL